MIIIRNFEEEWSTEVPKENGWYRIRYQNKNGPVKCRCSVTHADLASVVHTQVGDSLIVISYGEKTKDLDGVLFGPKVERPCQHD